LRPNGSNRAGINVVKQTRKKTAEPTGDLSNGRRHDTALLLIDVLNSFESETVHALTRAWPIGRPLSQLKARAKALGVPVIYVNDNFGMWQSNLDEVIKQCLRGGGRAQQFVQGLLPDRNDYCVLKPKHSGFFQTPLDLLLKHLQAKRLILTGLWTNNCVLFTAHDAYMRDFQLCVPKDCVAAHTHSDHRYGLKQMEAVSKAQIVSSRAVRF
jgi:nicotinamidase-related amidase